MTIEKTDKEILIRVPVDTDIIGLQRMWEYIRARELASKSKATKAQIDELANESKENWWKENKSRFIK